MKWKSALLLLMLSSLACNLARVVDPSLPTQTLGASERGNNTPSPIPSPTPTPSLEARVEAGDLAFFYGDWERALMEYQRALEESEDAELRSAALLGMGRSYLEMGEAAAASQALNTLLALYAEGAQAAGASFALARALEAQGNAEAAAVAYASYLELGPGVIDAYVQEWRGDALVEAGDYAGAISAYQAALAEARLSGGESVESKIGDVHFLAGDYQAAILAYQSIYLSTGNDYVKAQMDLNMGRAYMALEQPAQAYPLYLDAVEHFPLAFASYAALVELVNAGVAVDELDRGLVDYYAASSLQASGDPGGAAEVYSAAVAAFDRYLLSEPEEHDSSVHHFRALALRALDDTEGAIQEWNEVIGEHAFDTYWAEAYAQKALTQWAYLEDYDGAIETLLGFVAATPSQARAAEFLFTAGRIAERGGRLTRSAEIWQRVSDEYPSSEFAYEALFLAGISRYRLGELSAAQNLFVRASENAVNLEDQSQALFWFGKTQQANGDEGAARATWTQTATLDPTGYYSERAADLLAGREPFSPRGLSALDYDLGAERAEAEAWIISRFDLPTDSDLSSPGELASDGRFQRGMELWKLGEYELARAEFESLRREVQDDAANSYRLANALIDIGLYRPGIFAIRQVLTLAGMSDADTMGAPRYFNRVRFGSYFRELVLQEAAAEDFDPLFIYSVMRQESLFEGFVTSAAGARGLMQIIPSTGQEIATLSGWPPDFGADDLYRPIVSIRLGTDYLATQRNSFEGNLYAVLAAYNAGPGRASYWSSIDEDDVDLFLEVIHFSETSNYIRSIYELFNIYRDLYGSP